MLRRSRLLREYANGEYLGNQSRRSYEQNYRENLRMRAAFWGPTGRFQPISAAKYVWDRFGFGTKIFLGFAVGLWYYAKVVNWSSWWYQNKFDGLMSNREDYLKSTGKLKHPKYLVDPQRQIDDPDADNIPCYTIHEDKDGNLTHNKVYSKSFFDEYYEDDLHSDKRKWQKNASLSAGMGTSHKTQEEIDAMKEAQLTDAKKARLGLGEVGPAMPPEYYQMQMKASQAQQQARPF